MLGQIVQVTLLALVSVATVPAQAQASAPQTSGWVETPETCARLQALVTSADIEKLTGRKNALISTATPDQTDGCAISIRLPQQKTRKDSVDGIALTLRQHLSHAKAAESVNTGLALASSSQDASKSTPPRELARHERGRLFQLNYVYDHASAVVDATELTVIVRDQSLKGAVVASALGRLVFDRALASAEIAAYLARSNEVLTHLVVKTMLGLIERCSQPDAPHYEETRAAMAASIFNTLAVQPASTFPDYTQRWLKQLRADDLFARQAADFSGAMTPLLSDDCRRTAQQLPVMEQTLQPLIKHMQPK